MLMGPTKNRIFHQLASRAKPRNGDVGKLEIQDRLRFLVSSRRSDYSNFPTDVVGGTAERMIRQGFALSKSLVAELRQPLALLRLTVHPQLSVSRGPPRNPVACRRRSVSLTTGVCALQTAVWTAGRPTLSF